MTKTGAVTPWTAAVKAMTTMATLRPWLRLSSKSKSRTGVGFFLFGYSHMCRFIINTASTRNVPLYIFTDLFIYIIKFPFDDFCKELIYVNVCLLCYYSLAVKDVLCS